MTDCFIMIHVIIFFVGVTNTLSGTVGVVWPEAAAGLSVLVSKEVLCSQGEPVLRGGLFVGLVGLVFIESLCTNSRWLWVGHSYLYGREPSQTPLQNLSQL